MTLEQRNNKLFKELVPMDGNCETVEGEMLRAINKIMYRWMNDGDYFYDGYGIETAGSAHIYLTEHSSLAAELKTVLDEAKWKSGQAYEDELEKAHTLIIEHVEKTEKFSPNTIDMLDFQPERKWDDECY